MYQLSAAKYRLEMTMVGARKGAAALACWTEAEDDKDELRGRAPV